MCGASPQYETGQRCCEHRRQVGVFENQPPGHRNLMTRPGDLPLVM